MSSFAICNAAIFTVDPPNRVIPDGTLVVEDGTIVRVGIAGKSPFRVIVR